MNTDTAAAILKVAKEGGYHKGALPKDEDKLVEEAQFYLMHARAAAESGETDDEGIIAKIIELGEGSDAEEGFVPEEEEEAEPLAGKKDKPQPRSTSDDPPEMPYDLTTVPDKGVRRLSSQFQAHLNEVIRELSVAQTQALRAKQIRDDEYRVAYIAEANAAAEAGAKLTKEALDLAAQAAPKVKEMDAQCFELETKVRDLKALKEIYEGNVRLLSREGSLREMEARASRR